MAEGSSSKLSNIADVEIDPEGRFKYILIKVTDDAHGNVFKYIVRGFSWAGYHGSGVGVTHKAPQANGCTDRLLAVALESVEWPALVSHATELRYISADIYDGIEQEIRQMGLKSDCVGGGRIQHDNAESKIFVYGYSMGYGRADHSITVEKLKKAYPHYASITFSNEGY